MSTLADTFLDDLDELSDDDADVSKPEAAAAVADAADGSSDSDDDGLDLTAGGSTNAALDVLKGASSSGVSSVTTLRSSKHYQQHMEVL